MKFNSPTLKLELCLVVIFLGTSINPTADVHEKKNCTVSSVTEGKMPVMTFYLERNRHLAPDSFHAHLRRKKNDGVDILTCDEKNGNISCIVQDAAFQFEIVGEHTLEVRVPNVRSELEDTYILQVFVNGTKQPPFVCNLTLNEMASDIENGANNAWIIGVIVTGVLALIFIITVVLYKWLCPQVHVCGRKADNANDTTQADVSLLDKTESKAERSRTTGETTLENEGDRTDNKEDPSRTTGETTFKKTGAGNDINTEQSSITEGKSPETLGTGNDIYAEQSSKTGGKLPQQFSDGIKTKTDTAPTQSKLRNLRWDPNKAETVLKENTTV